MKGIKDHKHIFFALLMTSGCMALLYQIHPSIFQSLKNEIVQRGGKELLHSVKREILNSGKLIAKVNFPDSVLTYAGTVSYTNAERTKASMPTFVSDTKLNLVAEARMKDMFEKEYFEHVSPTGDSASAQADVFGYEYIAVGENIALGNFENDEALVEAWMNSPGHRANILSSKFTELGIAVGRGMYEGRQTWIAVQIFGRPVADCPAVDASLKQNIEFQQEMINVKQAELSQRKEELDSMSRGRSGSREEYEKKVDEYNALVKEVNDLIREVKRDVEMYNVGVKAFNACLEVA